MKRRSAVLSAMACIVLSAGSPALAGWTEDGTGVSTANYDQRNPSILSDWAGGAFIAWGDTRGSSIGDIYAQRIDSDGNPLWTADGVPVCTATNAQYKPKLASDGAGGVIIVWIDNRSNNYDIYAQRLDGTGNPLWTTDGVSVCSLAGDQIEPTVVSDRAGGVIIAWEDQRATYADIYAQRLDGSGNTIWTAGGVVVCSETYEQRYPAMVTDGSGGAIIAWQDQRVGTNDIYAQHVDAAGNMLWAANGLAICTSSYNQYYPRIASDGAGGAIIAWYDFRNGSDFDIYAQRVNASGAVSWTANGIPICTASNTQYVRAVESDPWGGAFIAWEDYRSGSSYDVYIQRVNSGGGTFWTSNGIAVCTAGDYQGDPVIASDGSGGCIVAWVDSRNGDNDIYAQRLDASSAALWTANGIAVCRVAGPQNNLRIVSNGPADVIMVWEDGRSGLYSDVYAQRIERNGYWGYPAPHIAGIRDVPGDQGGYVNLSFDASRLDPWPNQLISYYSIWRAVAPQAASSMIEAGTSPVLAAGAEIPAGLPEGALRIEDRAGATYYWQRVSTVSAYYLEGYSEQVPTLFDSTSVSPENEYFQVIAHTSDSLVYWISQPDSGYSVDNLAPSAPQNLAGRQTGPAGIELTWDPNTEPDLARYMVYRGTDPDFVPGPGNLLGTPADTVFIDPSWTWNAGYYYKVTAVDEHENESLAALLGPGDATGTGDPLRPARAFLAQNVPNPFNPSTRIAFGTAREGMVTLRVFDVTGRLVRVLVNGRLAAGRYEASWDGRDLHGREASSGVYFLQMEAGGIRAVRKMVLMK